MVLFWGEQSKHWVMWGVVVAWFPDRAPVVAWFPDHATRTTYIMAYLAFTHKAKVNPVGGCVFSCPLRPLCPYVPYVP